MVKQVQLFGYNGGVSVTLKVSIDVYSVTDTKKILHILN